MHKIICDCCGRDIGSQHIWGKTRNETKFMVSNKIADINGFYVDVCYECLYKILKDHVRGQ